MYTYHKKANLQVENEGFLALTRLVWYLSEREVGKEEWIDLSMQAESVYILSEGN
jgi:hypothetical protein